MTFPGFGPGPVRTLACALLIGVASAPAAALDLNSFRAQHGKPPLAVSGVLSALAQEQAQSMASRTRLDHKNFRQRARSLASTAAENVLSGCADEDCAIRGWARSAGHRRNMLRGDVSRYGIASAVSASGRRYWALELGNE